MKTVFVVYSENYSQTSPVMELLDGLGIDFYTRWERVKGKGHGSEAHLGTASFPAENSVLMIAFQDEALLEKLTQAVVGLNKAATRPDERVRLFQMPLERVV